jgi:sulfite reductase alpha subunit-like flavoprotein
MLKTKYGMEASQKISIDSKHPITVEEAIRRHIDLCSPLKNKRIIASLSQHATDPEELATLRLLASKTAQGEEAFQKYIDEQRITVVDLLRDFPSCQSITVEALFGLLPGIPPRYYSVSSSPLDRKNASLSLTVAFSVVDYLTPKLGDIGGRRIPGVATRYLEVLASGFLSGSSTIPSPAKLPIFPKPTSEFHLPASLSTPLILIGPGTGIAPFIGFLSHRRSQIHASEESAKEVVEGTWRGGFEVDDVPVSSHDANPGHFQQNAGIIELFFGCRHRDHDWLFQQEMTNWTEEGLITNLHTAFSRDSASKQYVQDLMLTEETRARLLKLITIDHAAVFVCGDGNYMAKGVQAALLEILSEEVNGNAQRYLEQMKKDKRFVMDIWS